MDKSSQTMAKEIAQAASAFEQGLTGHEPKSVAVVLGGETLVITLNGALSPAEQAMAQSPEGATKVRELHRQLFLNTAGSLRQEIKRITGLEVRDAAAEVEPKTGAIVQVFTSEATVQVFLLSGKVPAGDFDTGEKT